MDQVHPYVLVLLVVQVFSLLTVPLDVLFLKLFLYGNKISRNGSTLFSRYRSSVFCVKQTLRKEVVVKTTSSRVPSSSLASLTKTLSSRMEECVSYYNTGEVRVSGTTSSPGSGMRSQVSERVTVPGVGELRLNRTSKLGILLFPLLSLCLLE